MNKEVTDYIIAAPEEQGNIMSRIREVIHGTVPQLTEEFKWSRPVFKSDKDFAYLQANKNHVSLGFSRNIEQFKDPNGLLEGSGKTMRHIKIKKAEDIDESQLREWIKIASVVGVLD